MEKSHLLLSLLVALFLSACGGGGGGGDSDFKPTDPNVEFRVLSEGSLTPGSSSRIDCLGEDSDGYEYSAIFMSQTQPETTFLGEPAIPIVGQLQLTNTTTGAFASNNGTSYVSTSVSDRRYLGYSDSSTTTVSAISSPVPEFVKIGEFGDIGTYTDNAGNVEIKSWRVDDGGNGRAKFVSLSSTDDQFGNLIFSGSETDLIDTNGNVLSKELELFYVDLGVILTLSCS